MTKSLDQLTKQEWDTLFPIALEAHNPDWADIFAEEKAQILGKLDEGYVRKIEHFGSTSIPGIMAKAYIDMLIEVAPERMFDEVIMAELGALGYHYFRQPGSTADYMVFVKGYRLDGPSDQIFYIHMCTHSHEMWQQLKFRDYLRAHPERAKAYETLKRDLAVTFTHDRSGYRIAKTEFVEAAMALV